jgi:DNA (cytosine-5)-methyltransferase 1
MARKASGAPLFAWREGAAAPTREPARPLRVAGLFAGIGGIELGLHRQGHETVFLCENDARAQAVLRAHFPTVPVVDDVCEIDKLPTGIDLLTAGFPCQDLSQAGSTRGISGERSGLVRQVLRLLARTQVPTVLLENVPFMLQLGRGKALEVIIGGLEHLGYRWAYRVVDTRFTGIPQRRERVFLLASLDRDPRDVLLSDEAGGVVEDRGQPGTAYGFYWTEGIRGLGWAVDAIPTLKGGSTIGIPSPPAVLLPSGLVITPDLLDAERLQGFPENWTKPAEAAGRESLRWKLVGNAVTVDVADWVGQRLRDSGRYKGAPWDAPLERGMAWPRAAWNVGEGRFASSVSSWPARNNYVPVHRFLKYAGRPLSERATAGFLSRTAKGSLRFAPGFLDSVRCHLAWVRDNAGRVPPRKSSKLQRPSVPAAVQAPD